jgi:hypothetical protein
MRKIRGKLLDRGDCPIATGVVNTKRVSGLRWRGLLSGVEYSSGLVLSEVRERDTMVAQRKTADHIGFYCQVRETPS